MLDDAAARLQKLVLLTPEPRRRLLEYETVRAALLARHADSVRAHAVDAPERAQAGDVAELKRHAKHAVATLWSFHQA